MLRPSRTATATAAAALALTALYAAPAHADDGSLLKSVECGTSGGNGCRILLRWILEYGGLPGTPATPGTGGSGGAGDAGGSDEYADVDWDAIDWDNLIDWENDVDWDSVDWDAVFAEAAQGEEGTDPLTTIEEALADFRLPEPVIATSPGPASLILVNTPLWLWVDPQGWGAESTSAELGDTALTVTATPVRTLWTMGDGSTVECEGPGTPFDPETHDAASASPDCGYVYTAAPGTGAARTVAVRVLWDTEWSFSDGGGGALDQLTSTSEIDLTVRESHGLVTDTH